MPTRSRWRRARDRAGGGPGRPMTLEKSRRGRFRSRSSRSAPCAPFEGDHAPAPALRLYVQHLPRPGTAKGRFISPHFCEASDEVVRVDWLEAEAAPQRVVMDEPRCRPALDVAGSASTATRTERRPTLSSYAGPCRGGGVRSSPAGVALRARGQARPWIGVWGVFLGRSYRVRVISDPLPRKVAILVAKCHGSSPRRCRTRACQGRHDAGGRVVQACRRLPPAMTSVWRILPPWKRADDSESARKASRRSFPFALRFTPPWAPYGPRSVRYCLTFPRIPRPS